VGTDAKEKGIDMATMAQMRMALGRMGNPIDMKTVGANEAPSMNPKIFMSPDQGGANSPPPGGVAMKSGMPIGGIDMNQQQQGQQIMPMGQQPQMPQGPQGGLPQAPAGNELGNQATSSAPMGNMLQMTPQGQALGAMKPPQQPPQGMAKGGVAKSTGQMKKDIADKGPTRLQIDAEGAGGVKGIVVPFHMWHGSRGVYAEGERKGQKFFNPGMKHINEARAKVYGAENRDPLTVGQIGTVHKQELEHHFALPEAEQKKREEDALKRLRDSMHIKQNADTLDESEKLDTVRHEYDDQGRSHIGFAAKGVAGHALYVSGHGENEKKRVVNTCPGQTEGCGGGTDSKGIVDTSKGSCFAPNAEQQYVNASVRRACHEQAKHDPAMTRDWILAHTGSLREAARLADKNNKRLLFRPNVVDETDTSSRHVIRHLNDQRKKEDKPPIIANSYGKTNELHDPENGYYVTHSNVGPKVKKGQDIKENIKRDNARIRNTIMAADKDGDFKNEQGNLTPAKGSYMVTDVKRGSPMAKNMEEVITHAKYWSKGRLENKLTPEEKSEGPEGHFDGSGNKTEEEKVHYGHRTVNGMRYDYQRQHILHPRLVNVPERKRNKKTGQMEDVDHIIPTDSRFKDTDFLPEKRFKSKNGKDAGHILMTTPTESTSNIGHQTSFTHHVGDESIEHAKKNNGEYEIDKPEDQIEAKGKEYAAPQKIKFHAEGGSIGDGRHFGLSDDNFHAFPERNWAAQRHLAMRRGDDEERKVPRSKTPVSFHKNPNTMLLELTMRKKAK